MMKLKAPLTIEEQREAGKILNIKHEQSKMILRLEKVKEEIRRFKETEANLPDRLKRDESGRLNTPKLSEFVDNNRRSVSNMLEEVQNVRQYVSACLLKE